jgi:hypothetical protein
LIISQLFRRLQCGPYVSYYVRQAYSQGTGGVQNATNLQNYYNSVAAAIPPGKFIVQENFGDFSANGGTPFTEANGNTLTTEWNTNVFDGRDGKMEPNAR